jgi:hypothetical protein
VASTRSAKLHTLDKGDWDSPAPEGTTPACDLAHQRSAAPIRWFSKIKGVPAFCKLFVKTKPRKADAVNQVLEPRVRAQKIEARSQQDSRIKSLRVARPTFFIIWSASPTAAQTTAISEAREDPDLRFSSKRSTAGAPRLSTCGGVGASKIGRARWTATPELDCLLQIRDPWIVHLLWRYAGAS